MMKKTETLLAYWNKFRQNYCNFEKLFHCIKIKTQNVLIFINFQINNWISKKTRETFILLKLK